MGRNAHRSYPQRHREAGAGPAPAVDQEAAVKSFTASRMDARARLRSPAAS
jgi:hypothetical protein